MAAQPRGIRALFSSHPGANRQRDGHDHAFEPGAALLISGMILGQWNSGCRLAAALAPD